MGFNQLLLTVVGIMLVGVFAFMGLRYFREKRGDNLRSAMQLEITAVVNEAHRYYRSPSNSGGGSGSFSGFVGMSSGRAKWKKNRVVSGKLILESTNGSYSLMTVAADSIVLEGVGDPVGADGINPIKIRAIVKASRTVQVIVN
jgi:hypothetical protein